MGEWKQLCDAARRSEVDSVGNEILIGFIGTCLLTICERARRRNPRNVSGGIRTERALFFYSRPARDDLGILFRSYGYLISAVFVFG